MTEMQREGGDRLRWKEPAAYATNARYIKAQKILLRVLPQSAYADSSLPEGAFGTGKFALYITLAICLSAIASFEPRDFRVVFILQNKKIPPRTEGFSSYIVLII